jgi:hypothetical protein
MGLLDINVEPTRTPISLEYLHNKGWFTTKLYQMPVAYLCMTCWKLSKVVKLQDGVSEETINADLSLQYKIGGTQRLYVDLHLFSQEYYKACMNVNDKPLEYWCDEVRFFEYQVQRVLDELTPILNEPIKTAERLELITDNLYVMLTQFNISIQRIEDDRAATRQSSKYKLNGLDGWV